MTPGHDARTDEEAAPPNPDKPNKSAQALNVDDPQLIADRYRVDALLGRGGMASAYRVYDQRLEREVALKRFDLPSDDPQAGKMSEHFEREFHTLMQLAHPRVVQAFDYGRDREHPYYTMELLDGGDLRELAPLPWERVCAIAYDICSALSLLHSRRLVHRDLTPRNVRCTADGRAKLIDFGLLSPMGPTGTLAGTPPYVAPELVQSMTLDARSDLFSLGATLYFALTARVVFPARRFDQLRDLWRSNPLPPSALVEGCPPDLDALVLALLRIDVGSRPKSAAEVMERLRPLLKTPPDDELWTGRSFLVAPQLVGREPLVGTLRQRMVRTMRKRGGGFLIDAEAGLGRSRMLDAFVLEAKLIGAATVRASAADSARGPFGVAAALAQQLHEGAPELSRRAAARHPETCAILFGQGPTAPREMLVGNSESPTLLLVSFDSPLIDVTRADLDRTALLSALRTWMLAISEQRPLAIAIDDLDRVDEPSVALLASLSWEAPTHRVVYAVTTERGAPTTAPSALDVIAKHAEPITLEPLTESQILELLRSLFGDVPNLQLLSQRLQALCAGHPRECMLLAQHLVDHNAIRFEAGAWTLPGELADGLLPASMSDTWRAQIEVLSPLARRLGLLIALGVLERLSRERMVGLGLSDTAALDAALDELVARQVISGNPSGYAIRHGNLARLLTELSSEQELRESHRALARIYEQTGESPVAVAKHLLLGPTPEAGLDYIIARAKDSDARTTLCTESSNRVGAAQTAVTFQLALDEANRLGRPRRQLQALWVMLAGMSAQGEDAATYYGLPSDWLEQLKRDSGHFDYHHSFDDSMEPVLRVMHAFGKATERYEATPENDRVLAPQEAIKQLVSYVVFSIAVGARGNDLALLASLPALLQPFAPLNPMVAAMFDNSRGTLQMFQDKREPALATILDVLRQLDAITGADLAYVDRVRASLHHAASELNASLGVQAACAAHLEHSTPDPNQRVASYYVRKVAALQAGDWEAAERYRQQAELIALQSKARSMFSSLAGELDAHAMARDLTGLKQVRAGLHAMAATHPGWVPPMHVADAHYYRLCADIPAALAAARVGRGMAEVSRRWATAALTVEVELLVELGQADDAQQLAEPELSRCEQDDLHYLARGLACALAMAEAKLGNESQAIRRIERVIEQQQALGVTGLQLGRSYEHCARVAIWSRDVAAFERYAALAAVQYRPGESSVLGALYERLMDEARAAGVSDTRSNPADPRAERSLTTGITAHVSSALTGCSDASERAQRVLALLCHRGSKTRGFLFLLGNDGLTLSASNTICHTPAELEAFARRYLELELEDNELTLTAADVADMLDNGSASGVFVDQGGARYRAQLLSADVAGATRIVGIAVLSVSEDVDSLSVHRVAIEIARHLLEVDETRSAPAA